MEESFAMNGGDGAYSYSKNSQYQKEGSDSVMGMMEEAVISKLDLEKLLSISTTVTIADLGCSVGPNTFFTVQNLMKAFENMCFLQGVDFKKLEFQVLFNDQSCLPPSLQGGNTTRPGCLDRSTRSITVAHSAHCLQWLSELQPHAHQFTNEGRIHYTGASGDVARAYSSQFEKDVGVFLSARAEEIGEMTKLVRNAAAGCFTIQTVELSCPSFPVNAVNMITLLRSGMEGLFSKHFGTCVVDKMFANIFAKVEDNPHAFDVCSKNSTQLFLVLQRN
ncbi:hypothetical protein C2S51_029527 [Perilla frutescens var. frutescens]|nr:hypothetical protein C2S51_029527 [Perilla frutescens var. frutescens]